MKHFSLWLRRFVRWRAKAMEWLLLCQVRYPFRLCVRRIRNPTSYQYPVLPGFRSNNESFSGFGEATSPYGLFLEPDGLRRWIVYYSLAIGFGLWPISSWLIILTFLWLVVCSWFVFSFLNRPLLGRIWKRWPRPLNNWFRRSIPQRILTSNKSEITPQIVHPTIWRQPVNRFVDGSAQETILRAAMNELFYCRKTGNWNEGLWSWVKYWCFPAWASYLWLFLFLLPAILDRAQCLINVKLLLLPALIWGIVTILFLVNQVMFMASPLWGLNDRHLNRLPPQVQHLFKPISKLPELLDTLSVRGILVLVQTALLSIYLFIIKILV